MRTLSLLQLPLTPNIPSPKSCFSVSRIAYFFKPGHPIYCAGQGKLQGKLRNRLKKSRTAPSTAIPAFPDSTSKTGKIVSTEIPEEINKSLEALQSMASVSLGRRSWLYLVLFLLGMTLESTLTLQEFGDVESSQTVDSNDGYVRPPKRADIPLDAYKLVGLVTGREPEQVHVTLAGPNQMRVSWVTKNTNCPSTVHFGRSSGRLNNVASGESETYTYLGWRSGQIHHVILGLEDPLEDSAVYYYKCGSDGSEYSFKMPPSPGSDKVLNIRVVGDLGQTGWSESTLSHMAQAPHDLVLFAGDLAYADRYQPRWDTWGRLIEPLARSRPWMTTAGNHEDERLWLLEPPFKSYNARWRMPHAESGSPSNLFYSFESGLAHFIVLGSYAEFDEGSEQYRWLQNDLARVDRSKTPWLVALLHAPWYNSNEVHQGDGDDMMAAMEALLHASRVDVVFAGHVHAYERSARVFQGKAHPMGAVHITIGDGGNREGLATRYLEPCPDWSQKREASFGHGELTIYNSSVARWTWHRNQDDEAVRAEEVWIQSLHSLENGPLKQSFVDQLVLVA